MIVSAVLVLIGLIFMLQMFSITMTILEEIIRDEKTKKKLDRAASVTMALAMLLFCGLMIVIVIILIWVAANVDIINA